MIEVLTIFPVSFWVVILVLAGGGVWAIQNLRNGSGLPALTVLGTVAFWYVGDVFYNDYANNHAVLFDAATLQSAWWQVAWFLTVFMILTPAIHRWFNARDLNRGSGILRMFKHGVENPRFQSQLNRLFLVCALIWGSLAIIAAIRLKGEILYYFFPFLAYKAEPWGRGRIGSGFDALLSVAFYFQQLASATFGVVAALSTQRRTRSLALLFCVFSWPYFIFDRTRNTMLAVVVPAIVSWVFLRLRGTALKKFAVLLVCFLAVNAWMKFVIANRSNMSIVAAFKEKGFSLSGEEKVHHQGLNMYEELCWINTFMETGAYKPNWGARYFAEAVNVIPRALWPGKPEIGIDYAIARGQGGGAAGAAGVYATISTGMIGQGVVNFGRILGPAAAALIMSFWVAIIARLDLNIDKVGRILLYPFGLILTFNLGRDITLITLYPFVFGSMLLWWADRSRQQASNQPSQKRQLMESRTRSKTAKALVRSPLQRRRFTAPGRSYPHVIR